MNENLIYSTIIGFHVNNCNLIIGEIILGIHKDT